MNTRRQIHPPRRLSDHQINRANQQITILAGGPGPGGASHNYEISITSAPSSSDFPISADGEGGPVRTLYEIGFQDGPLRETGINGITDEALIAIIIDRLRGFQKGQFSCRENAIALTHFEEGLMWLHKRTANREARGVEGTHQV